jgi:hypothetical protein
MKSMFDFEDFVLLLEKKYLSALIALLLVAFCLWVLTRAWRYELRTIAIVAALLCLCLMVRALCVDYYVIALGNEVDLRAEHAFNAVKKRLSDRQLVRFLSEGGNDKNQQFYIALMAAQRGLQVPNAKGIARPGFLGTNSYTSFANRLEYPITYEELLRKYQETFGRDQP